MDKTESLGMKSLTREKFEAVLDELAILRIDRSLADLCTVITFVVEERMTYPIEVHTYLVGTSCLKTTLNYSDIAETLKNPVVGDRVLSIITIGEYLEAHPVVRISSDITDDGSFILFKITPYDSHIATFDGVNEKLFCQIQLSLFILCYY